MTLANLTGKVESSIELLIRPLLLVHIPQDIKLDTVLNQLPFMSSIAQLDYQAYLNRYTPAENRTQVRVKSGLSSCDSVLPTLTVERRTT